MATWVNVTGSRTRVPGNVTTEKHQQRYVTAGGSTPDRTHGVAGYMTGRRGRGRALQYTSALSVTWTAWGPSTVGNMMDENVATYSSFWWNVVRVRMNGLGPTTRGVEESAHHDINNRHRKNIISIPMCALCSKMSKYITIMGRWLL